MSWQKELVAASATPLLLSILSERENYGYAIIKRVAELTGGEMKWTDGMLYPVLHRLEKQGYVSSEWRTADSGRKRKYYRIKGKGRKILTEERRQWTIVHDALVSLWEAKPCPG